MKSESPDFNRNVHCVLGLPFDAVTLEQAIASIRTAIKRRTPCFLSTPNLNFLIAAQTNHAFHASVVHSDLSLADGMPIVWLAKLMGIPIPGRVAGSDVFDALRHGSGPLIKVYFFGGPPGVAERAALQINSEGKGMACVGFESPGYGSVEQMSNASSLGRINQSGADLLVVSLGAAKGQAWIEHNLDALQVPVVSHLGAVVNFVAGNVRRAPLWMQKSGLEWVWRVKEEPELWRRYLRDGFGLLKLLVKGVVPNLYYRRMHSENPEAYVEVRIGSDAQQESVICAQGIHIQTCGETVRAHLSKTALNHTKLAVKLSKLTLIPSDLLGLLVVLDAQKRISLQIFADRVSHYAIKQIRQSGCRAEINFIE